MAFNNSISSRLGDLRYRNNPTSTSESQSGYTTPSRYSGSFMNNPPSEARASLQRRFTTDLSKMQPLSTIGQQAPQIPEQVEVPVAALHKVQLLEQKRRQNEELREKRRRFEAELDKFKGQQERSEQELEQMMQAFDQTTLVGHQSEPTTPPEYRENVPSSVFSRQNRYSASTLVSPPGLQAVSRGQRSGSVLTSPPNELAQTLHNHINADTLPSKSVPASRRGSNDRLTSFIVDTSEPMPRNAAAASHRYSMPVTSTQKQDQASAPDYASMMGLGHINTTNFLFGDDEDGKKNPTASPDVNNYLQMNATDDKFPILVRRNQDGGLSASSTALDLALAQDAPAEPQSSGQSSFSSHRLSQGQMQTPGVFSPSQSVTGSSGVQQSPEPIGTHRQANRHSMEASLASYARASLPGQISATEVSSSRPTLGNLPPSLSTNDLPTMKSTHALAATVSPPKTHAEQHFHNHNASMGRIPNSMVSNRQSRDLSTADRGEGQSNSQVAFPNLFNNTASHNNTTSSPSETTTNSTPANQFSNPQFPLNTSSFYGNYGMQMMNMGVASLQGSNPMMYNQQLANYQQNNGYSQYPKFNGPNRFQDPQARVGQQRRMTNSDAEGQRFMHVKLEDIQPEIYNLCKDQHGCRYLQKKLEERKPDQISMIFAETNQHVVELMTDPFGNYLCQKLFEYSDDEQRTLLIGNAAPEMVKIALNQHGTRALQKMIEFISTVNQTNCIIKALEGKVVDLIQDLNGNHVIQKCLNRLTPLDAQFIFTAVAENCVVVGTHRHGCCVLQRCIDHASGHQKAELIAAITNNAHNLITNPFGNYVLQYIIDLQEKEFTDPLCYTFSGFVCGYSRQKFSSNVIEKCIRGADSNVAHILIEEMLNPAELEKLLRDNYANYVVQTAIEYADTDLKKQLVEHIEPLLPSIRQTAYHRRIQNKIHAAKSQGRNGGNATAYDTASPSQIALGSQVPMTASSGAYPPASSGFPMNQYPNGHPVNYQANGYSQPPVSYSTTPLPPNASYGTGAPSQLGHVNNHPIHHPAMQYPRPQANGFQYF